MDNEDLFQVWLMEMSDAIHDFCMNIPQDVAEKLDYSPDSLIHIEDFILKEYQDVDDAIKKSEAKKLDGISRYVGEVFRTHLGGKWIIDFSDIKNVFMDCRS